jgi:hypothetical protein
LIRFPEQRKQVFCTHDAEPVLAVPFVRYNGHLAVSSVTDSLLHPKIGIACFYALNFPV